MKMSPGPGVAASPKGPFRRMQRANWSSSVFHKPTGDGRKRNVFPLPTLELESAPRGQVCRSVAQRIQSRRAVTFEVNKSINALNSLFFGGNGPSHGSTVSSLCRLPSNQRAAIGDIIDSVKRFGPNPTGATGSEALGALRAASSGYDDAALGVGDVVPLNLDHLSLPEGLKSGVDLLGALDDSVRCVVEDFEEHMLQDADVWTWISRNAQKLVPYDDPSLRSKGKYLEFLRELHDRGILGFTQDCRERVGAFTVSKKPKELNGVVKPRQRLVLDCRQTNMMFRPSPHTQLGSLASLCDLELDDDQNLYMAGADIQDCFYAVRLPAGFEQFFVLREDLTFDEANWVTRFDGSVCASMRRFCPAIVVLPMGFSWSFYLVQHIHEQSVLRSLQIPRDNIILEGQPAPTVRDSEVLSMPYCDNIHTLCTDPDICNSSKCLISRDLEELGFQLHEDEPASTLFETLGGVVDGSRGEVRATAQRAWRIKLAFEHVLTIPVSGKTIQKLLGHAMFLCVLNRCGMSIFRSLYDFVERHSEAGGKYWLQGREVEECKVFSGLIPLLYSSLRRHWSPTVTCTDASPAGYGVCETVLDPKDVSDIGRWHEKWRFKRLKPEHWNPRRRAGGLDVLGDPSSVLGVDEEERLLDQYVVDKDFPEVNPNFLDPNGWQTKLMGKWNNTTEHITIKEGRALVLAFRRLCRAGHSRGKRHLFLCDNLSLVFAANKGRAHSYDMLRITQQLSALSLAGGFSYRVRWIPSEHNTADGPSRGQVRAGSFQPFPCGTTEAEGACEIVEQPTAADELPNETRCEDLREEEGQTGHSSYEERKREVETTTSSKGREAPTATGDRCGAPGSNWQDDYSGRKVSQCRGPAPVPQVFRNVREFLPNFRNKLAPRRPGRPRPSGLPRRDVRGGPVSQRGGEGRGISGIPFAGVKGYSGAQPSGLEGLAQREAASEQAASSCIVGRGHGNGTIRSREATQSNQAAGGSRHVSASWRIHRSQRKGPGCSHHGWRSAVSSLQPRGEGRRGWKARQGGSVRQQCAFQHTGQGIPRADPASARGSVEQTRGQDLQLQLCRLSKRFCGGWKDFRHFRAAPISASSRRGSRAAAFRCEGPCGREGTGSLAHRPVCETLHQDREDSAAPLQVVTRQLGVLSVVEAKHGTGPEGKYPSSSASLDLGWEDVLSLEVLPKHFCLEIFAGTARITSALLRRGLRAFPIDICLHQSHNLLDVHVEHRIIHLLESGRVQFLWLGMPCTSFSVARKNDGVGPGPLRDDDNLFGFKSLGGKIFTEGSGW